MDIRRIASPVLLVALVFTALLLIALPAVLTPVTPDGDLAADMLLGNTIRDHGLLLTGHYSRFQFNHPGPFFFYWNDLFERLLGWTGLSRFQTWMWGGIVLSTLFVSLAAGLLSVVFFGRLALAGAATFAVVTIATLQLDLVSLWMPARIVAPYLGFLVSLLLLVQGRLACLPIAVLLASIAVHGYVSMVPFTLPFLAVAFVLGLRRERTPGDENLLGILAASGAIAAAFAAPIVLDGLIDRPSNLSAILAARKSLAGMGKPPWAEVMTFASDVLARKFSTYCLIAVLLVAATPLLFRFDDRYAKTLGAVAGLLLALTVGMVLYFKSIPGPHFFFVAQFYQASVPLIIGASLAAMFFVKGAREENKPRFAGRLPAAVPFATLALALIVLVWPVRAMDTPNDNPDIREFVRAAVAAQSGPIALDYAEHGMWPFIAGLLLEFDRARVPACTTWKDMAFLYTAKEICRADLPANFRVVRPGQCGSACLARTPYYGLVKLD